MIHLKKMPSLKSFVFRVNFLKDQIKFLPPLRLKKKSIVHREVLKVVT